MRKKTGPWQNGLLATSALAAALFASSMLWQQGHAQWAFLLAFLSVWVLLSISWSNVEHTEESGTVRARIVDHNFDRMHERIEYLESELERLQRERPEPLRRAS